jgi:hypothetical protein
MRKLIVGAVLATVAVLAVPGASASAAELTGACEVAGSAKFPEGLSATPKAKDPYSFTGKAKCTDTAKVEHTGTVTITGGDGTLSCGASASETEGEGTLKEEAPGTETYKFTLSFVGSGPTVGLVVKLGGKPSALGAATFAESKKQPATQCPLGVEELEFKAFAVGTL